MRSVRSATGRGLCPDGGGGRRVRRCSLTNHRAGQAERTGPAPSGVVPVLSLQRPKCGPRIREERRCATSPRPADPRSGDKSMRRASQHPGLCHACGFSSTWTLIPGAALDLLADNIAAGDGGRDRCVHQPGLLAVTLPGSSTACPSSRWAAGPSAREGLSQCEPEMNWNVQCWRRPTRHVPDYDRHNNRLALAGLPFHVARHAATVHRRRAEDVRFMAAVRRGAEYRAWFAV
jgi:hypothetical protein